MDCRFVPEITSSEKPFIHAASPAQPSEEIFLTPPQPSPDSTLIKVKVIDLTDDDDEPVFLSPPRKEVIDLTEDSSLSPPRKKRRVEVKEKVIDLTQDEEVEEFVDITHDEPVSLMGANNSDISLCPCGFLACKLASEAVE